MLKAIAMSGIQEIFTAASLLVVIGTSLLHKELEGIFDADAENQSRATGARERTVVQSERREIKQARGTRNESRDQAQWLDLSG